MTQNIECNNMKQTKEKQYAINHNGKDQVIGNSYDVGRTVELLNTLGYTEFMIKVVE